MKVVFLSIHVFGETIGGIENHIYYLSKYLHRLGVNIIILTPIIGENEQISESITNEGIIVKKLYIKSKLNWLYNIMSKFHGRGIGLLFALLNKLKFNIYYNKVYKEIIKLNPDIVHQHDYLSNIVVTKKLSKIYPIIFTNHTGEFLFLEKYKILKIIQKKFISHYSYIIAPSLELLPNRNKVEYIPNGVDIEFFKDFGTSWKIDFRIKNNLDKKYVFLCPRRWAPTKGIIYFAKAINILTNSAIKNSVFLFAGSNYEGYNKYSEEILQELSKSHYADIRLLGNLNQDELREYYNASDVVIIPSLMEATSLAALESMACGTPVLSTNVGGMPEIIKNGINGWLIPPKSPESIAKIIEEVIMGKYNLKFMKEMSKKFVKEEYSWQLIAKKTLRVYNDILHDKF